MKKILASVLTLAIAAGSAVIGVSAQASPMGDVSLDGQVSIKDATTIQKACASLIELSGNQRKRADIDQNNKVNISDATALQRSLVGQFEMPDLPPDPLSDDNVENSGNLAMADFSVRLLQSRRESDSNVLVSPLSVMSALGMTQNGARGRTLSQMEQTLGISRDTLNRYCKSYGNNVNNTDRNDDKLDVANSIWYNGNYQNMSLNQDFRNAVTDYYKASVNQLPFDNAATQKINGWVNDNTDGMIPKIIDEVDPFALMYLVNALAFDGKWSEPFDPEYQVHSGTFTNADKTTSYVNYMTCEEFSYLSDGKATGFIKQFTDHNYAFAALVPNEGTSLDTYVKSLTGSKVRSVLGNKKSEKTDIYLPKFKIEYGVELSETLKSMGMVNAFDPATADFSNMINSSSVRPYINRVIHKTAIDVNETGTKAAAATVVEMKDGATPEEPHKVKLDRPFLYMLINTKTNTPFFIGTVDTFNK